MQGQEIFSQYICYENLAKYSRVKRQTDGTEQYVRKENYIKWLNRVGIFAQVFKDWRKIKRTVY